MNRIDFKPATTLREPAELVAHGLVAVEDLADLEKVAARYAVAVTPEIAALIDPDDPLRSDRAAIHSERRGTGRTGQTRAPIRSAITRIRRSPGIVHRYPDRVLFKLVHVCAVYCRFCFRREMVGPGKASALSEGAYDNALAYIRAHPKSGK